MKFALAKGHHFQPASEFRKQNAERTFTSAYCTDHYSLGIKEWNSECEKKELSIKGLAVTRPMYDHVYKAHTTESEASTCMATWWSPVISRVLCEDCRTKFSWCLISRLEHGDPRK